MICIHYSRKEMYEEVLLIPLEDYISSNEMDENGMVWGTFHGEAIASLKVSFSQSTFITRYRYSFIFLFLMKILLVIWETFLDFKDEDDKNNFTSSSSKIFWNKDDVCTNAKYKLNLICTSIYTIHFFFVLNFECEK